MSQSLVSNRVHIIFSTEARKTLITADAKDALWRYIMGIGKNLDLPILAVGGMPDHVHLLVAIPPNKTISETIQKLKANSSRWMKSRVPGFAWQRGYAAFSVSTSSVDATVEYIRNQERHHARRDFKRELLDFLAKNGVAYDERYVFD